MLLDAGLQMSIHISKVCTSQSQLTSHRKPAESCSLSISAIKDTEAVKLKYYFSRTEIFMKNKSYCKMLNGSMMLGMLIMS